MNALLDLVGIRSNHKLPTIVGSSVKLRRVGGEWKGCCPFHDDSSPSFTIFDGDERFHCFGCGANGDVLDFVQQMHSVDLREAAAMLTGERLPVVAARPLARRPQRGTVSDARAIWRAASPIRGTPAEAYLRSRAIDCVLPETLRFARLRYPKQNGLLPCLVALVTSADNRVSGIQRTFVREDGSGKADVPEAKLSLGNIAGGAIRLAPVAAAMTIAGGLEDGLSIQLMFGKAVWAVTGEGNMASLILPDMVTCVTIGADADHSGEHHAQRAAARFNLQGRTAKIIRPLSPYKDFNAELMGASA